MTDLMYLPLQPAPTPPVPVPTPPAPTSVTVELPPELYEKLDQLAPKCNGPLSCFLASPPSVVASISVVVALCAMGLTARLAFLQMKEARKKDFENDKRKAALEAGDALQTLYDALLDISDGRKDKKDIDLGAYRAAHAATRHAMLKLKRFGFEQNKFIKPFDSLRDTASTYVYEGDRDRSHPDLSEFNTKRRAFDLTLSNFVVQLASEEAKKKQSGDSSQTAQTEPPASPTSALQSSSADRSDADVSSA